MGRPTTVFVDRHAIKSNFDIAKSFSPNSKFVSVIKANAYGHGLKEVAQTLSKCTDAFGVACIEEALLIREAGIKNPVLLMEGFFSVEEIEIASKENFWLMVENQFHVDHILSSKLTQPVKVWFGIDTGMHRLGFQGREVGVNFQKLEASENVQPSLVVSSHFSTADDLNSNTTKNQINNFDSSIKSNHLINYKHEQSLSNSAGLIGWSGSRRDWQRPGYLLFGNSPFVQTHEVEKVLKPAMDFKSKIISLRDISAGESVGYGQNWTAKKQTRIATVTVGYADGYPRNAENGTPTLVHGKRCPLVGRVSMDMITIDVTDIHHATIGDEVLLWGKELPVNEIAKYSNSIGWELLSRITSRVPRHYLN